MFLIAVSLCRSSRCLTQMLYTVKSSSRCVANLEFGTPSRGTLGAEQRLEPGLINPSEAILFFTNFRTDASVIRSFFILRALVVNQI